jgi:hypothetical protein
MRRIGVVVLVAVAMCSMASVASGYTQKIDSNGLDAVSCVPGTTECVVSDSKGNALYTTDASATAEATWKTWSGPPKGEPSEAVACPASSLCTLVAGKAEGEGGKLYYATSLGGSWTNVALTPADGIFAASCPSTSLCVDAQKSGRITYSTAPASTSWTGLKIGSGTMYGVFCLSASFCATVNGSGDLYVANTAAHIMEESGWKLTDIDGSTALHGVACSSTSSCVAVDSAGTVVNLTIESEGTATVSEKQDIDGTNELTALTCAASTCVTVDNQGNIFASTSAGTSWSEQYDVGNKLTSVACASSSLCLAVDTAGNVTTFDPAVPPPSHQQPIDGPNSVNAVSCVPSSSDCVVSDSRGDAYYATNVRTSANGTWTTWSGPSGQSPSQAVDCPTSTLCVLADGIAEEGGGGDMYYASSLGGSWNEAFSPLYGVVAVSCGSSSLCVAGQSEGFIHYTTKPASMNWFAVSIGTGTMNAVDCFSSSFCAVVDSTGHVRVANTAAHIKEASGWKSTDVDGSTALHGVGCTSTTSCVAVDSAGDVLNLAIESSGAVTTSTQHIDGTNSFTALACTGSSTCAAVDNVGNVFVSNNGGESWVREHQLGDDLTSLACASSSLCLAADTAGEVTAFDTR